MPGVLITIGHVSQALILVGLCVVMYQVIGLQGRLLIRLDELERRQRPPEPGDAGHGGLAVGTPIPAGHLSDLAGRPVAPGGWRGGPTLLVHWSSLCGFCELLAVDLARLRGALAARRIRLVLASRDDAATGRARAEEHGLADAVLPVDEGHPLATGAFRHQGTPAAYLLDPEGRVARPLAVGGAAILDLAEAALAAGGRGERRARLPNERPLAESRIERNGLPAGTRAPGFRLPEVRGGTVALEDFRGRRVLLVFTDPGCGPCDDLLPDLARLHRTPGAALAPILVARGGADDARRKAERHGLAFPVVVQDRWRLSREYGIFAVPVAFLIDDDGTIGARVARGRDEILALVAQQSEFESVPNREA